MAEDNISLREYFEAMLREMDLRYQQRFEAQMTAMNTALQGTEKAIAKAEAATERRFESVNEFRQSLNDMQTTLMPRAEADARFQAKAEKIDGILARMNDLTPRAEVDAKVQAMAEKLDGVLTRMNRSEGTGSGLKQGWGYLIGAAGLAATVASLATFLLRH